MMRSGSLAGPRLPPSPFATVGEALAAAAGTRERLVLVDAGEQEQVFSWAEVRSRARRAAAALARMGVISGDRVAIILPTSIGFMDAFFGALLAGATPVPLYPPVRLGRLDEHLRATARMIKAAGAAVVVTDNRMRLLLGPALAEARPPLGSASVDDLLRITSEFEAPHDAEALALIQFSSGSTVDPKPVALRQRHIAAQITALMEEMPLPRGEGNTGVSWLPLYHDMGLIGCLLSALYYRGSLVLVPPELFLARPVLWLRALSRHRGLISPAPSFAYSLCLRRVRDEDLVGVDLSGWEHALCGAEPVSLPALRGFAERFARWGFRKEALRPVYGLAEASLAVTFSPAGEGVRAIGVDPQVLAAEGHVVPGEHELASVGRPVAGFEVEVRDEEGHRLPERHVGLVFARGPSVMDGYYRAPEATAKALDGEGWLDTGDLGFLADGALYVTGRAKDVVIIRGANHAPQAFEACLLDVEGLREGCAVALGFTPPEGAEEALLVLTERARDERGDDAALEARARTAIAEATGVRPHTVVLLPPGALPRTSSGKLRRREALRRFLAGELGAPAPTGPLRLALAAARGAIALARARRWP
ncbi:AMP-binding protein [Chondromyces crocatus]